MGYVRVYVLHQFNGRCDTNTQNRKIHDVFAAL